MPVAASDLADLGRSILELPDGERDAYLRGLDEDDLELVEQAITAAEYGGDWRQTPATMAHHLTKGKLKLWRYSLLLGEKFADAVEGRSIRQIWLMPRRYGKSLAASQWGPVWALDRYPWMRFLLVSYGDELALENAYAVRSILRDNSDVLGVQLQPDRKQVGRFKTTEGGGVLARGIQSGIVGYGAHVAVFDDPHKNWQAAHSAANREGTDNGFRSAVAGTLETDTSAILLVMTAWHEDDQRGRLLKRMEQESDVDWEVVRIPELAEAPQPASPNWWMRLPDPLGRAPGEPIEPERFNKASIVAKHKLAGGYLAASMYQQRPAPEEGSDIRRAWFRIVDTLPPVFDRAIASWDMKMKDKESGSYVVGQYWGRVGSKFYMGDQLRGQWNQATTENAIALMVHRHPDIHLSYVENTGNGPEVMQALRAAHPDYVITGEMAGTLGMTEAERVAVQAMRQRGMSRLLPVVVKGDKRARVRAVTGYVEGGDVFVLDRDWLAGYLEEMSSFPNGANDDQVDATSQALSKLARGEATARRAEGSIPKTQIDTRVGGGTMTVEPSDRRMPRGSGVRASRVVIPRGVPGSGR